MDKRFALRFFVAGLVLSAWVCVPQSLQAQGNSLFSGSGLTKGGTGGITGGLTGTGFSGSGSGGSGGSSGALGSSFGSGLGGQGGSSPFGGSGMSGTSPFGGAGASGFGNTSNGGMVGRTNTGFAGNSQSGQTTGGNARGATRNFGNGGGNFNSQRGNNNNNSQNQKTERTTSAIRPRLRVAFDYNVKTPQSIATKATTRIEKIGLKNPALRGVEVRIDGDQLILTGKVKNEDQSRLAANLLRQEPGVKSIRNDLEVEQPTVTE